MVWVTNLFTGVVIWCEESEKLPRCVSCNSQLPGSLTWGIIHGIAYCECGAPYRCLHRDESGRLLNKEPKYIGRKKLKKTTLKEVRACH